MLHNYLNINLIANIESKKPSYYEKYTINNNKRRRYDKNLNFSDFNVSKNLINLTKKYHIEISKYSDFLNFYSILS